MQFGCARKVDKSLIQRKRFYRRCQLIHHGADRLGGFDEALASAAERAELGDDYRLSYRQRSRSWSDRLITDLLRRIRGWVGPIELPGSSLEGLLGLDDALLEQLETSARTDWAMWAWCPCEIE